MRSALGSIVMVTGFIVLSFGWICFRTLQLEEKMDDFGNCANCLALAMLGETDFLLSMCTDLAKSEYSSFYEGNPRLFSDGVLGHYGTVAYSQGLTIATFALILTLLSIFLVVKDGNGRHALPAKLFMFGFNWSLLCLVYILVLSAGSEETFPERGTCWVLNITLAKTEIDASVAKWIWISLVVYAGVILSCSALACCCNPQKLSNFFVTTGSCIAFPGFLGFSYFSSQLILWETKTLELWVLFGWNLIMLGAIAYWIPRIRNDEHAHASDVGSRVSVVSSPV